MAKDTVFVCKECGDDFPTWKGQCPSCKAWNSLDEIKKVVQSTKPNKNKNQWIQSDTTVKKLGDVALDEETHRYKTTLDELNRVLGGGLMPGSIILLGGAPGVGKSTILMQLSKDLQKHGILYVSGEESNAQIALRAQRLCGAIPDIHVISENSLNNIFNTIEQCKPNIVIIDSIQTIYLDDFTSSAGSTVQIRECTAKLMQYGKRNNTTFILVGHINKNDELAGPKVLEHMVDTVLYFESEITSNFRLLRAIKNRFGSGNELGIFTMEEDGLHDVSDPSNVFIEQGQIDKQGSSTLVMNEGTRSMLIEVQALLEATNFANPKRFTSGIDSNRVAMLMAVLNKYTDYSFQDKNVFMNIVGGLKIQDTALDLALVLSLYSAIRKEALPKKLAVCGEVGLLGEIRPIPNLENRIREAKRLGIQTIIVPKSKKALEIEGIEIIIVNHISQIFKYLSTKRD